MGSDSKFKMLSRFIIFGFGSPGEGKTTLEDAREFFQETMPKVYEKGILWWGPPTRRVVSVLYTHPMSIMAISYGLGQIAPVLARIRKTIDMP